MDPHYPTEESNAIMAAIGRWSVRNRVTVNLLMIFVALAGILSLRQMRREMFPQFTLDMVLVEMAYPGATPEEVEEGICIKIEEKIKGVEDIDKIFATAREGGGSVWVELKAGADSQKVLDDIKTEVDLIDSFPEEAEDPVVSEIVKRDPSITVAVYGAVDEKRLRREAEIIRDDLLAIGSISQVQLVGVRDYEIAVEVSEDSLRRYRLTFDDVVQAVRNGSIDLPAGAIKTASGEILVRSKGQLYTGAEFARLPLITLPGGATVRLGDVADVRDDFEDVDLRTRFNAQPAALVRVYRTSKEDVVTIADAVQDYVAGRQATLPPGIHLATWLDLSLMVKDRIDLLLRNGCQGILLVFLFLALFLNLRLAFWVAAGIPIAFMGAFILLDFTGETINMISLFAFIMTLGIVVDDAIIVGENVFTHYGEGKTVGRAVVDGLKEVGGPVIMAVATTAVAFTPLMAIPGIMGKFIAVMPKAVITILLVSLGEALIILPAHLDHALSAIQRSRIRLFVWHEALRRRIENGLRWVIARGYTPSIRYVTANRYFTFTIGLGVLIVSLSAVAGGYVPFVFFPKGESDWVIAEVQYPVGTPFARTEDTIAFLEAQAFDLDKRLADELHDGQKLVRNVYALVGKIPRRDWKPEVVGGNVGEVWIEVVPSEQRPRLPATRVLAGWREAVGELPGVERLAFSLLEGGPAGSPLEIRLSGFDLDQLQAAADALKQQIARYPGTFDIGDDFQTGKMERRIRIRDDAWASGVTMQDIARQMRQAFYGEEALRIQRNRDDVKVMVRYTEQDRERLSSIDEMRIRTRQGQELPIESVAAVTADRAYAVIHRVDRRRVITVASDLDEDRANAEAIVADLAAGFLPELVQRYPGIGYDLEGQAKRTRETMASLKTGFGLALMGIFMLLASQFRSYYQPVIIMTAIPFGLIGAVLGHWLTGMPITMISIFGIVALSGIVVNDSLILVDFINRAVREGGMSLQNAVEESGRARFRAVLLTSVTTIAGLLPLLLERSFQAQFLIPMAVSISFGLLVATVLTLLYVPALYLIAEDIMNVFRGRRAGTASEETTSN
jgi:HAE1 family hydrophobic/amphiphilic exporter-1